MNEEAFRKYQNPGYRAASPEGPARSGSGYSKAKLGGALAVPSQPSFNTTLTGKEGIYTHSLQSDPSVYCLALKLPIYLVSTRLVEPKPCVR